MRLPDKWNHRVGVAQPAHAHKLCGHPSRKLRQNSAKEGSFERPYLLSRQREIVGGKEAKGAEEKTRDRGAREHAILLVRKRAGLKSLRDNLKVTSSAAEAARKRKLLCRSSRQESGQAPLRPPKTGIATQALKPRAYRRSCEKGGLEFEGLEGELLGGDEELAAEGGFGGAAVEGFFGGDARQLGVVVLFGEMGEDERFLTFVRSRRSVRDARKTDDRQRQKMKPGAGLPTMSG